MYMIPNDTQKICMFFVIQHPKKRFWGQHMVLSVRLAFDAVVEINGYSQMLKGSGYSWASVKRGGSQGEDVIYLIYLPE